VWPKGGGEENNFFELLKKGGRIRSRRGQIRKRSFVGRGKTEGKGEKKPSRTRNCTAS